MKIKKAIEILEALASGCSPQTGELIENESVLNERDVIRALERVIYELERLNNLKDELNETDIEKSEVKINNRGIKKTELETNIKEININNEEVDKVIKLFQSIDYSNTCTRLTQFFLKSKQFDSPVLNSNELYGKYFGHYKKQDLENFFRRYFLENGFTLNGKDKKDRKLLPWENVTFFKLEKFNNLTEKAIEQLKGKINEIGILKTEDLTLSAISSRVKYFRAYESWSDIEKELLEKAMKYTNDVELLSECFQRGNGSIKACGKRLIHERNLVLNEGLS
jgi:hypothetical protein